MFDTEKLILNVKNYPCLWDASLKEYKDNDLKKLTWYKVTERVFEDQWPRFTSTEKQAKVKEVKDKKWRHVRDSYKKYISGERHGKNGSETVKKKTCAYSESLSFLNGTIKRRRTTSAAGNFKTEENSTDETGTTNVQDYSPQVCNKRESLVNISSTSCFHHKPNEDTSIPFQNQLTNGESELEDKNIVMSFLPYLKNISYEEKLDFHLNGLLYLKNIIQKRNSLNEQTTLY